MTPEGFLEEWRGSSEYVEVTTSGSTGSPKRMCVEKRRMAESARTTCSFLGLKPGDTALLCMSADFIAGKMMIVRAEVRGLKLKCIEPSGHPMAEIGDDEVIDFAAMVPMQVINSMESDTERRRLKAIKNLIIGGGPVDDRLAERLAGFPNAVYSTYGMTETLSHIALRRLSGPTADDWYTPFDAVDISLSDDGCLCIDAPAICATPIVTNDLAEISPDGERFRIIGRRDNVICSGGLKIQIEEVEEALRSHISGDFLITKIPDQKFGEICVLLHTAGDADAVNRACSGLPRYSRPKFCFHIDSVPLTPTGKPARAAAAALALSLANTNDVIWRQTKS